MMKRQINIKEYVISQIFFRFGRACLRVKRAMFNTLELMLDYKNKLQLDGSGHFTADYNLNDPTDYCDYVSTMLRWPIWL